MSDIVLPLVLVAGAGGLVLVEGSKAPAPIPTQKSSGGGTVVRGPGATQPGTSVVPRLRVPLAIGRYRPPFVGMTGGLGDSRVGGASVTVSNTATSGGASNSDDPTLKGKLNQIEAAAQTAYDNLGADAKAQGAAAANSALNLNPPLTGDEDYATMASVIGGATGAAAGAYIGGPYGAKIGAIVGAYLGVKLEDLISKNWDDLTNWLSSKWSDVQDAVTSAVGDAASSVGDSVSSAASSAWDYASQYT